MTTQTVNNLLLGTEDELIKNGRYHLGGERFTRVTNFVKTIEDRFNLERHTKRMVAVGITKRPDLVASIACLDPDNKDDKNDLNDLCEKAYEAAGANAKRDLGSALHKFAERVDRGEEVSVPVTWAADIAAYRQALVDNNIRIIPDMMERVIVNRIYGVAGRFDRVVTVDGHPKPYIADIKTGNLDFGLAEMAAQMFVYATADNIYDETSGTFLPMPDVDTDRAIILHLPAGQGVCEPVFIDLPVGKKIADLCLAVREVRRQKVAKVAVSEAPTSLPNDRARWLIDRALMLKAKHPEAFAELAASWPAGVPTFKAGGHTASQLETIASLISTVEAKHEVPFGDSDPDNARPASKDVKALIARLNLLPAELLDAVKQTAKDAGIPNLEGRKASVKDVRFVDALVSDAEQAAVEQAAELAAK